MTTEPKQIAEDVRRRVHSALSSEGWEVELQMPLPPRFTIRVEHALSPQYLLSMDASKAMPESLARVLDKFEFRAVAKRPDSMPHAALVKTLRGVARASGWAGQDLAILADVLGGFDVLLREEAEWLATTGPAWDDPPRSGD
jgi:hypothetical protein